MRTIGTILGLILVIALGIWLFDRGDSNPGIPSTGDESSLNATSTDNGMNGSDNDGSDDSSSDYNVKG